MIGGDALTRDHALAFFDEFVEAFATFRGEEIARRYRAPYLAMGADGATHVFQTRPAIAEYFQRVVDGYRSRGCCSCRYGNLEIAAIGRDTALGTVTWELLRDDGGIITSWRESYLLVRAGDRLETLVSIDHAEVAPARPLVGEREDVFHIATDADLRAARASGIYRPASLAVEGFIHCSTRRQVRETVQRFFAGRPDLHLMQLDAAQLRADLRYEPADPPDPESPDALFPHLYAALPMEAVLACHRLRLDDDGRVIWPRAFGPVERP